MKKLNKLFALLTIMIISLSVNAQTSNSKVQSVFIYNFTKMVSWPAAYQSGDFIIGVIGTSPIIAELETMAQTKKVGNQNIVVQKFATSGDITKCHILFVPASQTAKLGDISAKLAGISALVVTESEGAAKNGATINFVIVDNKQRFELNESNANKRGLKVGADLAKLAILVN